MLFLLILNFCSVLLTSGKVGPLYSTPRKTVALSSYRGRVFQEAGVLYYSTMLLMEDMGMLVIGARETIFALDLMDITNKKAMLTWAVTAEMSKDCTFKGKTENECHNYIRVLHKMSNGVIYVCGTNAFDPKCNYLSYTEGNLTLQNREHSGREKCPFDPFQRAASVVVDGELYSATSFNFRATEMGLMRSINYTVKTESYWLNESIFIGLVHVPEGIDNPEGDDDKIYLFFIEKAVEYDAYNKLEVSRVARVCKGDEGGISVLQKKWTSFLKARLDCPVAGNRLPLLIQNVFLFCSGGWKTCVFYGVFTPQTDMPLYSAVCAYTIEDIRKVFSEGDFKVDYQNTSAGVYKWIRYNGVVPDPRPGACINNAARQNGITSSGDLPAKTLDFVRDKPLMDRAVTLEQPLLLKKGAAFTCIVVASTTALDGSSHKVMFIGTASGSVLKAVNYDGNMVIIEEVQLFNQSVPVTIMRLSTTLGQLYAGSDVAVVQMPLSACGHYTSCMDCVLARNPYCGWDLTSESCTAINNIQPDTHSKVVQNLRDGNASRCPAVETTTTIITLYAGKTIRLACKQASNLAQVKWSVNNRNIENSNKYQIKHNSLSIIDASDSDCGTYTCIAIESSNGEDYVTQKATYDLKLAVQSQQETIVALSAFSIILALLLLALVIWNFCKGHFTICRCSDKFEESPYSVSVFQELKQRINRNREGTNSNRNIKHNRKMNSRKQKTSIIEVK